MSKNGFTCGKCAITELTVCFRWLKKKSLWDAEPKLQQARCCVTCGNLMSWQDVKVVIEGSEEEE